MHPKDAEGRANSVDPDQAAQSDLDQHCLLRRVCPETLDYYDIIKIQHLPPPGIIASFVSTRPILAVSATIQQNNVSVRDVNIP